jgi:hypothetical protein
VGPFPASLPLSLSLSLLPVNHEVNLTLLLLAPSMMYSAVTDPKRQG